MEILLNWFPPAFNKIPSPAMSVLKGYLNQFGHKTDVYYWNLIMRDIISSIVEPEKGREANEFEALMPFLAILLNNLEENIKFGKLCSYYQTKYPQYFNLDKEKYYSNIELEHADKIVTRFNEILIELYSRKKYKLVGVCTKLLQLVPANIFAEISKLMASEIPIVAGGMSNKNEAIATLENFENYDYAIWGEGENPLHQLCRFLNNEISIEEVPNLAYRRNGEVKWTGSHNRKFSNLDTIKPDYSDYFKFYRENNISDLNVMVPVESSRGCHWSKCKFCF